MKGVIEVGLALLLSACVAPTSVPAAPSATPSVQASSPGAPKPTTTPRPTPEPRSTQPTKAPPVAGILIAINGPGWSASALDGPTFPAGVCHYRYLTDGQALPDPHCTPGAIDTRVNDSTLSTTICRSGYTTTVRPPYSLTGPAKRESLAEYGATGPLSAYEYDHLVPLELGGASSTYNLWAEPNLGGSGGFYLNAKDKVENALKYAVCGGRVSLRAAQLAIVSNWESAESALGL